MISVNQVPEVKAEMLIRRPVEEVYEAFVNPEITTKFWFTKSSGLLESGSTVRWDWEMYGVSANVRVLEIESNKRILIEWGDGDYYTKVEWIFTARGESETFVSITNSGFKGNGDEIVAQAIDSMGGFTMVLCGLKAFLEHGVQLNLVGDKAPDHHI